MAEVHLISVVARGMVAGEVGTIAMTVSELLEMSRSPSRRRLSRRSTRFTGCTAPAWALYGVSSTSPACAVPPRAQPFRAPFTRKRRPAACLGIADVPWRWAAADLGTDLLHKGVYAVTGPPTTPWPGPLGGKFPAAQKRQHARRRHLARLEQITRGVGVDDGVDHTGTAQLREDTDAPAAGPRGAAQDATPARQPRYFSI